MAPTEPTRLDQYLAWFKNNKILSIVMVFAVFVIGIGSFTDAVWKMIDHLKPATAAKLRATITNVKMEHQVSFAERLRRENKAPAGFSAEELQTPGKMIVFSVEIEGFSGRKCSLNWSVFDAETNARAAEAHLVDQLGLECRPEAQVDQASPAVWVPVPQREGKFFVRLHLYDDKKMPLAFADTEAFQGIP